MRWRRSHQGPGDRDPECGLVSPHQYLELPAPPRRQLQRTGEPVQSHFSGRQGHQAQGQPRQIFRDLFDRLGAQAAISFGNCGATAAAVA